MHSFLPFAMNISFLSSMSRVGGVYHFCIPASSSSPSIYLGNPPKFCAYTNQFDRLMSEIDKAFNSYVINVSGF